MIEFFTLMCEHPVVFFMFSVFSLVFVGMTYEFILGLFKRKRGSLNIDDGDEGPSEGSLAVNPDGDPVIVQNTEQEYVKDDSNKCLWNSNWNNESEGV